jgi:nucleotide-binding universal stress UspA family protein
MANTILVPIDFQVESLHTLKEALALNKSQPTRVVLLYAEYLGDSITELLFYSPEKVLQNRMTPEFTEALEIIKNRFEGSLTDVSIKVFHGVNTNALANFCDAIGIDSIYIPATYKLKTPKRAFNPVPHLKKSALPVTEVG